MSGLFDDALDDLDAYLSTFDDNDDEPDDGATLILSDGVTFEDAEQLATWRREMEALISCPRCGDRLDDVYERAENLCRPCMLTLMDITPDELDRWLHSRHPIVRDDADAPRTCP